MTGPKLKRKRKSDDKKYTINFTIQYLQINMPIFKHNIKNYLLCH